MSHPLDTFLLFLLFLTLFLSQDAETARLLAAEDSAAREEREREAQRVEEEEQRKKKDGEL